MILMCLGAEVFPAPPGLLDGADRLSAARLVAPQAGRQPKVDRKQMEHFTTKPL